MPIDRWSIGVLIFSHLRTAIWCPSKSFLCKKMQKRDLNWTYMGCQHVPSTRDAGKFGLSTIQSIGVHNSSKHNEHHHSFSEIWQILMSSAIERRVLASCTPWWYNLYTTESVLTDYILRVTLQLWILEFSAQYEFKFDHHPLSFLQISPSLITNPSYCSRSKFKTFLQNREVQLQLSRPFNLMIASTLIFKRSTVSNRLTAIRIITTLLKCEH